MNEEAILLKLTLRSIQGRGKNLIRFGNTSKRVLFKYLFSSPLTCDFKSK